MGVDLKLLVVAKEESARWHVAQAIELARNYSLHDEVRGTLAKDVPEGIEVETGYGWRATDGYGPLQFTTVKKLAKLKLYSVLYLGGHPVPVDVDLGEFSPDTKVVLFWH